MTAPILVPVSPALVNAVDVSAAFTGATLQTRGASWVEFGSYGSDPFPSLLPPVLGFSSVFNRGRAGRRPQDNAFIMADSDDPYAWDTSYVGPALIHEPGNSLIEADTPANRRAALESVRAMVALMSATSRVEQSGWDYRPNANGEDWNAESDQPYASGGSARIGFFTGLEVDIPVSEGNSYLLCHGTDASRARGATLHVSQHGVEIAVQSLDGQTVVTPNEANLGVSPVVVRLPDLDDGIVTVTVDQLGVAGSFAILDALLPQAPKPRQIILVKPTTLNAPTHSKPDLLAYLRTVPDIVAAEFGDHVIVVDPQPGWDPATMLGEDGLHPTPEGTAHLRDAIVTAFRARTYGELARVISLSNPTWFNIQTDIGIERLAAAWSDAPLENPEVLAFILETALEQVLAYADEDDNARVERGQPIPRRLLLAQLQQSINLWNASTVSSSGEVGAQGFSYTPRPLDKTIRSIIRPTRGTVDVF